MPCRDCLHYLPSEVALKPRAGLAGYGYCKAAPCLVTRARLFHDSHSPCWLSENSYKDLPK
jgi:hypothetical protein